MNDATSHLTSLFCFVMQTIIIYLLTDDLHNKTKQNKDVKWEVLSFIRFSKVIVHENYIYKYFLYKIEILF